MIAAPRQWVRSFALWLSLAVVLTCSLGSFGSPVQASSGSAFNAFTSDVTLGPARAAEPEKERREQSPTPNGAGQTVSAIIVAVPARPQATAQVQADSLPAPPAAITVGAVGARAPPRV